MIDNLHYVKDLGLRSKEALEAGRSARVRPADARALGAQEASAPAACPIPDRPWYDAAMANGALGGKLIGAGGGGFLMFYAEDKRAAAPRDDARPG